VEPAADHGLQIADARDRQGGRLAAWQRWIRYPGAILWRHLYTWIHSRKLIRSWRQSSVEHVPTCKHRCPP